MIQAFESPLTVFGFPSQLGECQVVNANDKSEERMIDRFPNEERPGYLQPTAMKTENGHCA
jgi:hypothetical protein